jgi:hypothetical protein
MLQKILEIYALLAREFSDGVACLGRHDQIGPEFLGLIDEIKRWRGFCDAAAAELDRYISQRAKPHATE